MSAKDFFLAVKSNSIFRDLQVGFLELTGRGVGPAELASWFGSLPRLCGAMELAGLSDSTYVAVESEIPYYSERIDVVLYGYDPSDRPFALLIELKQWSAVSVGDDTRLTVPMREGLVSVVHPSLQVDAYRRHVLNFVRAFHTEPQINVACCVYAHNYPEHAGPLFDPEYLQGIKNYTRSTSYVTGPAMRRLTGVMRRRLSQSGAE